MRALTPSVNEMMQLLEGKGLTGRLCEHVMIDKLPFTPPDSPVEEALAEWLTIG